MSIFLIILIVVFVIGFIISLSGKQNNSIQDAGKTGCGCVIISIVIGFFLLVLGKTCSRMDDPNSGLHRQIEDGYNLYD